MERFFLILLEISGRFKARVIKRWQKWEVIGDQLETEQIWFYNLYEKAYVETSWECFRLNCMGMSCKNIWSSVTGKFVERREREIKTHH